MITLVEIFLPLIAYLTVAARILPWKFNQVRPLSEPLNCQRERLHSDGSHIDSCYRQRGLLIDTQASAFAWAFVFAAFWPFFALAVAIDLTSRAAGMRIIKPTRAETEAKTKRLEHELGIGDKP